MKDDIIAGVITGIGAGVLLAVLVILTPLFSACGGWLTGWVLACIFPFAGQWVANGAGALGIEFSRDTLPMVGAFLGFVGAFFKSTQTNKNKDK